MTMWVLFAAALTILAVAFALTPLLRPLLAHGALAGTGDEIVRMLDVKERSLRALKDLDLDFAMGKMSADDYASSRESLMIEVAKILQELKEHGSE